jgi:hypothetical protein
MFAKLAKLAELRAFDPRHAAPRPIRLVHSRDNQIVVGLTTARRRSRRPILLCRWHSVPGDDGRLECSWHVEPSDDSPGEGPGKRADTKPFAHAAEISARSASVHADPRSGGMKAERDRDATQRADHGQLCGHSS